MKSFPNMRQMRFQQGLSLVELMVAIAVGLLLLTGVIQILTNSTQAYRLQNQLLRVQENGQFAMEFLAKDIRSTDFWGCLKSLDEVENRLNSGGTGFSAVFDSFSVGIDGTENASGSGSEVAGSDTIIIRSSINAANGLSVQPPYGPTKSAPITVGPNSGIEAGDVLLVADCVQGDIFQVTSIDANGTIGHAAGGGSPGNASGELSKIYTDTAFSYLPYTHTYSVMTGENGQPSLFRTDDTSSVELVEGVANMIVLFGEDTTSDGNANRYVRANNVFDMNNVVSVRIELVLQSEEDNLNSSPQSYELNGQTITPTDNRLYRVYASTIVLRNRSQ